MGIVKTKTTKLMAFILATVLIICLIPLNVKADQTITITEADLDVARKSANHTNPDKGIQYFEIDPDEYNAGKGQFMLYESTTYVLGEDIALDGETLVFKSDDGPITLDLNNKTINYVNEVKSDGMKNGAVNNDHTLLTITGDGSIETGNGMISVLATSDLIINGGTYTGKVLSYDTDEGVLVTVNEGEFNESFDMKAECVVNGGVFTRASFYNDTTIERGSFEIVGVYANENYTPTITINDGLFVNDSEYYEWPLELSGAKLIVNGGMFVNLVKETHVGYALIAGGLGDYTSIEINGGFFYGSESAFALYADSIDKIEINGGTFSGYEGALFIVPKDSTRIILAGGNYSTTSSDNFARGAIFISNDDQTEFVYDTDYFNSLLKDGYEYVPKALINELKNEDGKTIGIYTQKDIKIVPQQAQTKSADGDTNLENMVNNLVDKLKAGQKVEGIDDELADEILTALANGKEILINKAIYEVSKEDIAEDVTLIDEFLAGKGNVTGFYDICIEVLIDGEWVGNITKLPEGVSISVPVLQALPQLADGMQRIFYMVRIHDGLAAKLDASYNNGIVTSLSDSFSTYALVYEDVTSSPQTGDGANIGLYVILVAVSVCGIGIVIAKKKVSDI
ncbi:MAG: hypothetical protein E7242_04255 [Lachnospiraceae bacterium]|nr:hypothetical protein [Lachnospiraceae bacterium]